MKKIKFLLAGVFVFLFMVPHISFAHMGEADKSVVSNKQTDLDTVLAQIFESQDVNSRDDIDCEKLTEKQYEEIGEIVMGLMHPDENEHKMMDNMMGGEGSSMLKRMHSNMGRIYLGCIGDRYMDTSSMTDMMQDGGMMQGMNMMGGASSAGMASPEGMVNGGMMEEGRSYRGDVMIKYPFGMRDMAFMPWWGWTAMAVVIILFVLLVVWIVNELFDRDKKALSIIKERYAKGEINDEEYKKLKNDLKSSL